MLISIATGRCSAIDPDVFHTPAVIDAVDLQDDGLYFGAPADRLAHVIQDRPDYVLLQLTVDLSHALLVLFLIALH